jgi:hypothetical protein
MFDRRDQTAANLDRRVKAARRLPCASRSPLRMKLLGILLE